MKNVHSLSVAPSHLSENHGSIFCMVVGDVNADDYKGVKTHPVRNIPTLNC